MIPLAPCLAAFLALVLQSDRELLHLPSSVLAREPSARRATTFEGIARGADGAPASGALVFSDAGGMAVAGADGSFRLSVEIPLEIASVRLTAMDRNAAHAVGSVQLAVRGAGGAQPVGVLQLAAGTCAPSWLPSSGVLPGVWSRVLALALFDDGSGPVLVVGGELSAASGNPVSHVAAWDGSSWSDMDGGTNNLVRALAVHDDGLGGGPALYAGGDFISAAVGSVVANRIARWDGDEWQALGAGLSARVLSLTSFAGDLIAGGEFLQAGSLVVNRVARWTGTDWEALGAGLGAAVADLAVFDDGLGGGPALHAAVGGGLWKWNGSTWASLATGITSGVITELVVFDDGGGDDLYLGGTLVQSGGAQARGIARWNGTSLAAVGSVVPGTGGILDLFVGQENGSRALFAAGAFSVNGSDDDQRVARWNGASWADLGSADDSVMALAQLDDGSLYAGGEFVNLGYVGASMLSRWDGTSWSAFEFGTGFNFSVWDVAVFDDGSGPALYATGPFTNIGGMGMSRIARYDGTSWSPLSFGLDSWGLALEVFDDGLGGGPALYVGGDFTIAGNVLARRIARWDGTSWSALGEGMDLHLHDLEVFDDGLGAGPALYACGDFFEAGTTPASRIAKWDGSAWHPLGSGVNNFAIAMKVFDAGSGPQLYVGGHFTQAGGVAVNRIARWNGMAWSSLPGGGVSGQPLGGQIEVLEAFDDGLGGGPALYAGGLFSQAGGLNARNIARWNGTSWSPLGSGASSFVLSLAAFDDGTGPALYAGGAFASAGGGPAQSIARWNGTSWTPLGSGLGGDALCMAVFDASGASPALYVGGAFPRVPDTGDSYLARWSGDSAPEISHPEMVRVRDTGTPGEIVTFTVTASDSCDPTPTLVCVPPSGSFFPPGETIVTCTASDSAGHQSTRRFPVFVGKIRRR